jgi:hypothetical protein
MIAIGLVWLATVVLWLGFGPKSFFYMWQAKGAKRGAIIAGIYLVAILYQVFVVGWLVPLAFGTYRLVKHR